MRYLILVLTLALWNCTKPPKLIESNPSESLLDGNVPTSRQNPMEPEFQQEQKAPKNDDDDTSQEAEDLLPPPGETREDLCKQWSAGESLGSIQFISEASGLAISASQDDMYYHIDDSGNANAVYRARQDGSLRDQVFLGQNTDWESLSLGPCLDSKQCLYVADIGDNMFIRGTYTLYSIDESQLTSGNGVRTIRFRYEDGASHNAEGTAVHPQTGDLYIFTKEDQTDVFRISRQDLDQNSDMLTASYVRSFPFPISTGASISPSGDRILILDYQDVYEIRMNLSKADQVAEELIPGTNYQRVTIPGQPQQEAVSFLPNENSFIFSSEQSGNQLYKVSCLTDSN
ncbi:hypothetical protein [Pseudobacteriovorax antillogorgiicola]|uniref:Uncharacterized protein n=1 Tax=Pseudobacteriovorax antillogorgiicola TaxID=1513793 RepID=A0A1Y6BKV9_9BACT|nr:hypothetical protein [Pseudobacteriovorax antillogorgiicola]TCS56215.1 hypothetical protein EDD56_10437 [Pseudobacteriovorax antillogorgiicola]SMF08457.1 hypothetical protein SAMN06296036_104297 [Pseudobacteriovorax antillogorgiicola]